MIAHGFVTRMSEDIDLFTPNPAETLALFGRAYARDLVDVAELVELRSTSPGDATRLGR
jgi:hypothetical protein